MCFILVKQSGHSKINKELLTYSFIVIHVNQNLAANKRQKSM